MSLIIKESNLPVLFLELHLDTLSSSEQETLWQIDSLLPQTQCGLCGYKDGCLPYAHAIVSKGEAINLCVPGGDDTSQKIAQLVGRPFIPAMPSKWETNPTTRRPNEVRAVIDESACIGCTKCIPACPVDAIIGTAKHMHSIMTELCTGCELCLPPCPVDCISLVPHSRHINDNERKQEQISLKSRYYAHLNRLSKHLSDNSTIVVSHTQSKITNLQQTQTPNTISSDAAKNTIELAKLRTQIKKLEKQLAVRTDNKKQVELDTLKSKLNKLELASQ